MRNWLLFAVLTTALVCSFAMPAHARARVFVASYGNDANPCTFGSPCKTFQQAVNVVDAGGEVTAIDSAGFGPINITKPVTITSPDGVEAGIVPTSGGDAITINTTAAADITLRGLTLLGGGVGNNGINLSSTLPGGTSNGGTLNIVHCTVNDFTGSGIVIQPKQSGVGASPFMNVVIADSWFLNNIVNGVKFAPQTIQLQSAIYRTIVSGNGVGIDNDSTQGPSNAFVVESHVDGNANPGITIPGLGTVAMKHSTAFNNSGFDVSNAGGDLVLIDQNTIGALANNGGGSATTDGTNNIFGLSGNPLIKQSPQ